MDGLIRGEVSYRDVSFFAYYTSYDQAKKMMQKTMCVVYKSYFKLYNGRNFGKYGFLDQNIDASYIL